MSKITNDGLTQFFLAQDAL